MTVLFMQTARLSRSGLSSDIEVMDKETFMEKVRAWNERSKEAQYLHYPDYRYAYLNGSGGMNFKKMKLKEFEEVFSGDDVGDLGRLLEIPARSYANKYPVFLKEVYLKYGYPEEVKA